MNVILVGDIRRLKATSITSGFYSPAVNTTTGALVINTAQNKFNINNGVGGADAWVRKTQDTNMTVTFDTPIPASEIGFVILDVSTFTYGTAPTWTVSVNGTQDTTGIFQKEEMTVSYPTADDDIIFSNGVISFPVAKNNQYALIVGSGSTMVSSLTISSNGVAGDLIGYSLFAYKSCDTDGDGLADKLDLDSDNDGCFDAIEGAENFIPANLQNASGAVAVGIGSPLITSQNLGNTVNSDGLPNQAAPTGQAVGDSKDVSVNACDTLLNSDGDRFTDDVDLDDDNDGILDEKELQCVAPGTNLSNYNPLGTISFASGGYDLYGKTENTNISDLNITHSTTGDAPKNFHVYSDVTPYAAFQGVYGNDTTPGSTTFIYTFNEPIINLEVDLRDLDQANLPTRYERVKMEAFYNGTAVTNKKVELGANVVAMTGGLYENQTTDETETSVDGRVLVKYFSPVNEVRVTSLANLNAETVLFFPRGCVVTDTDNDGTPDYLDLDSDNDGCFDAVE